MSYSRAHIRLQTQDELMNLIKDLKSNDDNYLVEDFGGIQRVSARSVIGMLYAMTDFNDDMYLVNLTSDGNFPSFVDKYRVGGNV